MKFVIRAVGKMRDRRLEDLCREYLDRLRRHVPVDVQEVDEDADLMAALPHGAEVVALDPTGEPWSTEQLIKYVDKHMVGGTRALVFLIGGASGLAEKTRKAAHRRWSLSNLTFPHRLARVILAEQLYRAVSDLRGEPYNK